MRHRPIHWSEGMFLRPQHFQAADRFWVELISTADRFGQPYNYGVYEISINETALTHYQLEIHGCKARLKDGSIIAFDSEHVDRVDLRDGVKGPEGMNHLFVENETVTVYLAVPQLVEGRPNVSTVETPGQARFVSYDLECDDESGGGNRQPISFRDYNFRLMMSTDDRAGYECLPICRIKRSSTGDGTAVLDHDYFPPCLRIKAWDPLGLHVVRAIYDLIAERLDSQAQLVQSQNINFSSLEAGDQEKLMFLNTLNQSLSRLCNVTFADGLHPFIVYSQLCEIIGLLSIFSPDRRVPEYPRYDHDNLAPIFRWAHEQIKLLVYRPDDSGYEQRYFIGAGRGMEVALETKWFAPEWDWYVGVDPGGMASTECFQLLASGAIDWKLGSSDQIDELFRLRMAGVQLIPVKQVPRALPSRGNWVYFSISKGNDAWKRVELTRSLGMRVKEEQIHNLTQLQGSRKIILAADQKLVSLEFCVFAVRKKL